MDIEERILEILCNKCNIINYEFCKKHCMTNGDYKVVKTLLEEFEDNIKEKIEYDLWEQLKGEDL